MKKNLVLAFGLCAVALFTSCKSRESAYRQAWEQAMAQDKSQQNEQEVTSNSDQDNSVTPVTTPVTIVTTPTTTTVTTDNSDVREINANLSVISGSPLKTYSVVVGSFITQANAEGLRSKLQQDGYDARVIKTDEQIKGYNCWFRVIAASYDDKASAVQTRSSLSSKHPGAWLLYRK